MRSNMALMVFLDSEVHNDKSYSKTYLKNYETLKKQCDDLIVKLHETEFKASTYKRGLTIVEYQLVTFRKNEVLFSEEIAFLKREVGCNDYEIGLDEFKEPKFNGYSPRDTVLESTIDYDKESENSKENTDDSLEKEQVSNNENSFVEFSPNVVKETIFHVAKKRPRGNQRNWNGPKSNQLGSEFVMYNKACYGCGSFSHIQKNYTYHQRKRMVTGNNYNRKGYDYYAKNSHPSTHRNMPPRAVLLKSGLTSLNTARPTYTAHPKPTTYFARPMTHFSKQAQSTVQRPFYKKTTLTNRYFNQKVNIVRPRVVNTARPYTASVNTVRAYRVNAVKISLKFKLFSVSQMCDKRNYVLFTGSKCLVLSPDFNLPDESQILLKIPRKDNMYSFDIKNIIPKEGLTYLVAKATLDESMLWHIRLGHINFKNINKLVKENLVKGIAFKTI
ncbi:putative ribonuclease H-like domain-containing protein [Tanacetum coccineum]